MRLEFPEGKHEKAYFEMIKEFANANEKIIPEATNLKKGETYDDFLQRIKNSKEGKNLKPGYVAGTLYFLINNKERIVWTIDIRHELNKQLKIEGWNIAYSIRPSERKKWYATIWLKLGLKKCKELWMDKVLITCDKKNIWSSKVIIKNGGILDTEYRLRDSIEQRYWIQIQ